MKRITLNMVLDTLKIRPVKDALKKTKEWGIDLDAEYNKEKCETIVNELRILIYGELPERGSLDWRSSECLFGAVSDLQITNALNKMGIDPTGKTMKQVLRELHDYSEMVHDEYEQSLKEINNI